MLSAILFDLDGTVVDSDPIHYQVWEEILKGFDITIDDKFYKTRISGKINPEIVKDILPQLTPDQGEKLAAAKEVIFRQLAENLQPLAGFAELIAWTQKHGLKRGLVTNAPRLNADFMLDTLGIREVFHTIVLAHDCVAGKPSPIPYQVALQNLGITPDEAIALEDSPSGIRAAVAAGITTVGITTTHTAPALKELSTFIQIPDFTDLQLWTLLNSLIEIPV